MTRAVEQWKVEPVDCSTSLGQHHHLKMTMGVVEGKLQGSIINLFCRGAESGRDAEPHEPPSSQPPCEPTS